MASSEATLPRVSLLLDSAPQGLRPWHLSAASPVARILPCSCMAGFLPTPHPATASGPFPPERHWQRTGWLGADIWSTLGQHWLGQHWLCQAGGGGWLV